MDVFRKMGEGLEVGLNEEEGKEFSLALLSNDGFLKFWQGDFIPGCSRDS